MKRFPKFSLQSLLLIVAILAIAVNGLLWVHRLLGINPASEIVASGGKTMPVVWTQIPWESGRSGVTHPQRFIAAKANVTRPADARAVEQPLFEVSYSNYFGRPAFAVTGRIEGWFAPDWSDYLFSVTCLGGGVVDGAMSCDYEFRQGLRCLDVHVQQRINSKKIAKKTTLRFVHDGRCFQSNGFVGQ